MIGFVLFALVIAFVYGYKATLLPDPEIIWIEGGIGTRDSYDLEYAMDTFVEDIHKDKNRPIDIDYYDVTSLPAFEKKMEVILRQNQLQAFGAGYQKGLNDCGYYEK